MRNEIPGNALPWWKHGHVWLVIAGPAVVVIAGFVTLFIAVRIPDPIVAEDYYRQGIEINKTLEGGSIQLAPAVEARNHAATGTIPAVKALRQQ
jgi:uncharacterized protein